MQSNKNCRHFGNTYLQLKKTGVQLSAKLNATKETRMARKHSNTVKKIVAYTKITKQNRFYEINP